MIQGLEWSLDSSLLAVWNSYKQVSYFGLNGEIIKQLFYDNFKCIGFLQGIFSPNNDLFVATCLQDGVRIFPQETLRMYIIMSSFTILLYQSRKLKF